MDVNRSKFSKPFFHIQNSHLVSIHMTGIECLSNSFVIKNQKNQVWFPNARCQFIEE